MEMPHSPARIWALLHDYERWAEWSEMVERVDVLWPGDEDHNGRLRRVFYKLPDGRTGSSLELVTEADLGRWLPADDHGLSKYVIAQYLEGGRRRHSADGVELRLFGVFGRHEDYAIRFISNAICKSLLDLPITLRQNRRFSYLYVDDLGPIVEAFLESQPNHVAYTVVPDWTKELLELGQRVQARSGKPRSVNVAKAGVGLPYTGSNARLRSQLADVRFTPVDLAIDQLYRWYEANLDTIDRAALLIDK